MKIAVIVDSFPKISETFVVNELIQFEKIGMEYQVYSFHAGEEEAVANIEPKILSKTKFINIPRGIFAQFINLIPVLMSLFSKKPAYLFKTISYYLKSKMYFNLRVFYLVDYFLRNNHNDIDFFYCHFGMLGEEISKMCEIIDYDGEIGVLFHGYDISAHAKKHKENSFQILKKRGDYFLPTCEYWKEKLLKDGFDPDKTFVHYMGIDTRKFDFVNKSNNDTIQIVSIGRLVEKKGFCYSIEAVKRLVNSGEKVEYRIIGEGKMRSILERMIKINHLENYVFLEGAKNQSEVIDYLKKADVLLHPSITADNGDMESMPLSIKEACAVGVIVVATKHGGIPEIIIEGKTGFLAEERDSIGIENKIRAAMACDKSKIKSKARETVEEKFDVYKCVIKLFDNIKIERS